MMNEKPQQRILNLIKSKGPITAAELGKALAVTSMGARQHLERMEADGLVCKEDIKQGVGRPKRLWKLTEKAHPHFPDRHDQLSLDMLISIKDVFGEEGMNQLIEHRTQTTAKLYHEKLDSQHSLEEKIQALVETRSQEGYMADYHKNDNSFVFIENHCPVCAAARACQGFCRSELEVFQELFDGLASVERTEHIIKGARRCCYLITPTG